MEGVMKIVLDIEGRGPGANRAEFTSDVVPGVGDVIDYGHNTFEVKKITWIVGPSFHKEVSFVLVRVVDQAELCY
jgi:hypothetical protein